MQRASVQAFRGHRERRPGALGGRRPPPRSPRRPSLRRPVPGRLAATLSTALATLAALACASPAPLVLPDGSLTGYRTWSWHEGSPSVTVPPDEAPALQRLLAASLERGLAERGYRRVPRGGDFTVEADLQVLLRVERGYQAMAPRALWSHHASPSYWIEGSRPVVRTVRQLSLLLVLRTGDGGELSTGSERRLVELEAPLPVAEVVAGMLAPIEPSADATARIPLGTGTLAAR